jgi:nitrite reductase/ring-hydroxylating ferredoxin subunit
MASHVVARVSELPPGERIIRTIAGRSIGVFNVGGEYFALRNRCPHQGAALCQGRVQGAVSAALPGQFDYDAATPVLRCPWHGWEFDMRTGGSWFDPRGTRVRSYDVTVVAEIAGAAADLPVAETYPVAVHADYVVVEI